MLEGEIISDISSREVWRADISEGPIPTITYQQIEDVITNAIIASNLE